MYTMKKILRKLTAIIACAAMLGTQCAPAYAAFKDPAEIYTQYTTEKAADENTIMPDDDETKVTEAEEETDTGVTVPAREISFYSFRSVVTVGDTFKVGYRMKPANSNDIVTYSTSNVKVAKIDAKGNITALKAGTAVISVKTSTGITDRFNLTVKEPEETVSEDESYEDVPEDNDDAPSDMTVGDAGVKAKNIELKHSSVTINQGETYTIRYELTPKNSTDTVTYRSLNKAVASVDKNGVVTARGAGNTRIVCQTSSGVSAKLNVTVLEVMSAEEVEQQIEETVEKEYSDDGVLVPSEVRFAEESASVQVGESINLNARVYPAGCTYKYTIGSDNTAVAKVNSYGVVTGISPGNAIITITTDNGKTDSVYITVYGSVIKGIDVSKWNGDIDWKTVKKTGMANFAMIRASYGYEDTDPMLAKNVKGCEANNIPYGFYHYMYAKNTAEAKKEAAYFLNVIQDYSPQYPVVLDIEEDFYKQMPKKDVTAIVTTFMEAVENAGYYAMIYSYAKFFDDNLIMSKIEPYDIWVACWGDEQKLAENYSYHYGMWQYSETGKIAGIDEYVDLNYSYKDYKATIEKYGLNKPKVW